MTMQRKPSRLVAQSFEAYRGHQHPVKRVAGLPAAEERAFFAGAISVLATILSDDVASDEMADLLRQLVEETKCYMTQSAR